MFVLPYPAPKVWRCRSHIILYRRSYLLPSTICSAASSQDVLCFVRAGSKDLPEFGALLFWPQFHPNIDLHRRYAVARRPRLSPVSVPYPNLFRILHTSEPPCYSKNISTGQIFHDKFPVSC